MTPSRALRTIGERVDKTFGEPSLFGIKSLTPMAQDACGFGVPPPSIRHIRQLPAIDSRSWKQKRGISAPAASQAWSSVYSGGTSISLPSTMSLVIFLCRLPVRPAASRRLPQLCSRHAFPTERMVGRTVRREIFNPLLRLDHRRPMTDRNPPHHGAPSLELVEPFLTPAIETLVHGLPNETLQRFDALP